MLGSSCTMKQTEPSVRIGCFVVALTCQKSGVAFHGNMDNRSCSPFALIGQHARSKQASTQTNNKTLQLGFTRVQRCASSSCVAYTRSSTEAMSTTTTQLLTHTYNLRTVHMYLKRSDDDPELCSEKVVEGKKNYQCLKKKKKRGAFFREITTV